MKYPGHSLLSSGGKEYSLIDTFQHADNGYHYFSILEKNNSLYEEEYGIKTNDNSGDYYYWNAESNELEKYTNYATNISCLDKRFYCYLAGVFVHYLEYDKMSFSSGAYHFKETITWTDPTGWDDLYGSEYYFSLSDTSITFDDQKRLKTFSYSYTRKEYYRATLVEDATWNIYGEYSSFGNVVIEPPETFTLIN